jgi:hypothetical protein
MPVDWGRQLSTKFPFRELLIEDDKPDFEPRAVRDVHQRVQAEQADPAFQQRVEARLR